MKDIIGLLLVAIGVIVSVAVCMHWKKFIQEFTQITVRRAETLWFIPNKDEDDADRLLESCSLQAVVFEPNTKSIPCFFNQSSKISNYSISGRLYFGTKLPRGLGRKIYIQYDPERQQFVNKNNSYETIQGAPFVVLDEFGEIEAYLPLTA